jgi:Tfp pilus assembly protein PilF
MNRGAKITLVVFVILLAVAALGVGSWFIFKNERAQVAESYLNQGDSSLDAGNYAAALIAYKKAALLTPHSFAPYYKEGMLARTTGHYHEAIDYFRRSLNFGPQETGVYLNLGETQLLNNDPASAKSVLEQAKNIVPTSDEIDFFLMKTALKENNLDAAEKYLEEAEKNNPLPKYIIYKALLESLNDPSKSLEELTQINSCADIGGLTLADFSDLFQKLISTENTTSREIMIYQTFNQIGELDFGILGLEKITGENPQIRDAWVFLAYGYLMQNEPEKAKTALDKAADLDPVFPATYYLLSKYYETTKDTAQAQKTYTKAKELGFDENNPLKS